MTIIFFDSEQVIFDLIHLVGVVHVLMAFEEIVLFVVGQDVNIFRLVWDIYLNNKLSDSGFIYSIEFINEVCFLKPDYHDFYIFIAKLPLYFVFQIQFIISFSFISSNLLVLCSFSKLICRELVGILVEIFLIFI